MSEALLAVWRKEYEVGISSVDAEHRILFRAYNNFVMAMKEGDGPFSAGCAISFLEDYVKYHFLNEEDLMVRSEYDRYSQHILRHRELLEMTIAIKNQHVMGLDICGELMLLFNEWIFRHVVDEDCDIGTFLRCKERQPKQHSLIIYGGDCKNIGLETVKENTYSGTCITKQSGRTSMRYYLNIPGQIINMHGGDYPVNVLDISQSGARLTKVPGLFREATGILFVSSLPLPELSFIVVNSDERYASVVFALSTEKQLVLQKHLMTDGWVGSLQGPYIPYSGEQSRNADDIDSSSGDITSMLPLCDYG